MKDNKEGNFSNSNLYSLLTEVFSMHNTFVIKAL